MAKVWFVRQENRLCALGGRPAYARPLETVQWSLDIGLHRFYTDLAPVLDDRQPPSEFTAVDMVLVEIQREDLPAGSNYKVGFYSSPYSPQAAVERFGQPWA